jgi:hypothetical protein
MAEDDLRTRQFMGHAPWDLETARANVGPGWHHLLPPIFETAEALGVSIDQVKEKLGVLRVYAGRHSENRGSRAWETVDRVIRDAERQSGETCEVCGAPGRTYDWDSAPPTEEEHWWIKTLCDRHAADYYQARGRIGDLFDEHRA